MRHCEKLQSISKLDSLGTVAVRPLELKLHVEVPFIGLAIPVNYKLNAYRPFTDNHYVPKQESRILKLRMGAEDELTQIDTLSIMPIAERKNETEVIDEIVTKTTKEKNAAPNKSKDEEASKASQSGEDNAQKQKNNANHIQVVDLRPSKSLCKPVDIPPIHIFVRFHFMYYYGFRLSNWLNIYQFLSKNPMPGLNVYHKLLPYSGVDLNHHLNPLPRFERDVAYSTQRKFLDREVRNRLKIEK